MYPGTLNLKVKEESVHRLLLCPAVFRERGSDVVYPPQFALIPTLRVGYLYFRARLTHRSLRSEVLVRRAVNPIPTRIEALAELRLRDSLGVSDGDSVICEVDE
jgi:CTP-dependent riboflavin kinase